MFRRIDSSDSSNNSSESINSNSKSIKMTMELKLIAAASAKEQYCLVALIVRID